MVTISRRRGCAVYRAFYLRVDDKTPMGSARTYPTDTYCGIICIMCRNTYIGYRVGQAAAHGRLR